MAITFLQIVPERPRARLTPGQDPSKPTTPPPAPPPPKRSPDDEITGPEIPATVLYERWARMTRRLADRRDLPEDRRLFCKVVIDAIESGLRQPPKRTKR